MIRPGDSVLIACESSATVRDAFLRRGIDAWSCDLKPTEGRAANHLQGDVRYALEGRLHRFPEAVDVQTGRTPTYRKWAALIAFPDCTYLCSSGLHWNKRRPGRAALTTAAVEFVRLLLAAEIPLIALENPIGRISTAIQKPDQVIQPYQFGHDASKRTCLWLKGLPKLVPTQYIAPKWKCHCGAVWDQRSGPTCPDACDYWKAGRYALRWGNQTASGQNKLGPSDTRATERARTYRGVAEAMAQQWTEHLPLHLRGAL